MPKLFDDLAARYRNRPGGYTRIHKLPPRYGDMAPLAILELVDGKRDMLQCMTARNMARSVILGTQWVSKATRDAMFRLFQFRGEEAIQEFEKEVARQHKILLKQDKEYKKEMEGRDNISEKGLEERLVEREIMSISLWDRKGRRKLTERRKALSRADRKVSEGAKEEYFEGRFRGTVSQYSGYLKDEAKTAESREGKVGRM